jgi:hypothetical protein
MICEDLEKELFKIIKTYNVNIPVEIKDYLETKYDKTITPGLKRINAEREIEFYQLLRKFTKECIKDILVTR